MEKLRVSWQDIRDDAIVLVVAGIPAGILMVLITPYLDYSYLY